MTHRKIFFASTLDFNSLQQVLDFLEYRKQYTHCMFKSVLYILVIDENSELKAELCSDDDVNVLMKE